MGRARRKGPLNTPLANRVKLSRETVSLGFFSPAWGWVVYRGYSVWLMYTPCVSVSFSMLSISQTTTVRRFVTIPGLYRKWVGRIDW